VGVFYASEVCNQPILFPVIFQRVKITVPHEMKRIISQSKD